MGWGFFAKSLNLFLWGFGNLCKYRMNLGL